MRVLLYILCLFLPNIAFAQRIAVLEFTPGVGVSIADVDGLSSIFVTYFAPDGYTLVERSQIDKVIDEQSFQRNKITEAQMVRLGEILNLSKIVVGNINVIMGEYNVDVRVINVETGTIVATEGASFTGGAYRDGMKQLAINLAAKISNSPIIQNHPKKEQIYSDDVINALLIEPEPLTYVAVYNDRIFYVNQETFEKIDYEEKCYGVLPEAPSRKVIYLLGWIVVQGGEDAFAINKINFGGRVNAPNAIDMNLQTANTPQIPFYLPSRDQCRKIDSVINELNAAISKIGGEPLKSQYWTNDYKFYDSKIWGMDKFRDSYCYVAKFSYHNHGGEFITEIPVMDLDYKAFFRFVIPKHRFSDVLSSFEYID